MAIVTCSLAELVPILSHIYKMPNDQSDDIHLLLR